MKICWKHSNVIFDDYKISFSILKSIKEINITFKDISILFLGVQLGINTWKFYYEDSIKYEKLLKLIAEERKEVNQILYEYVNDFNEMHTLWEDLIHITFITFKIKGDHYIIKPCSYSILDNYHISSFSSDAGYLNTIQKISSISDTYKCLVSLLPENIEETRKLALEQEELELIRDYTRKQQEVDTSTDYSDSDYYSLIEKSNLNSELKNVTAEIEYWEKGLKLNIIDKEWCVSRIDALRKKVKTISKVHEKKLFEKLVDQFGTIEDLKMGLLKLINGLDFNEALSFYSQYCNITKELESDKSKDKFREALAPYDLYIEFYQNASVFVSNYLNEINKFKSKKVLIPQSKINTALMYMYNTYTVEEAFALRKQKDYIENRGFGDKGETEVDYALKWLIGNYIKVERTPSGKYGAQAIILNNKALIDEPQEFDHIVLAPQGIFNIETKNYSGKLIVDTNGNWIRIKTDGSEIGEKNPLQQIRRHEAVLKSIVGKDVPIISILVMANPKMIIEGIENFPIPLLKSDRLEEYISTYKNNTAYTKPQLNDLYNLLEQYRVSK